MHETPIKAGRARPGKMKDTYFWPIYGEHHLERALRAIPMGRRNWQFSWTAVGARHAGIVQSLIVVTGRRIEPLRLPLDPMTIISSQLPVAAVVRIERMSFSERERLAEEVCARVHRRGRATTKSACSRQARSRARRKGQ